MTEIALSDAEKLYVINGIQDNLRVDGRGCMDYRIVDVETDVQSNCSGSAHIRLANNDVLVGIKAELDTPDAQNPNKGRIEVFVDCSPNANPEFEGRGGEEIATEISRILTQAYNNARCLDLSSLCVIPGVQVWVLYVDIIILQCGGSLIDTASLAVKAALFNTKIPAITIKGSGEGTPEIEVSDDPYDVSRLDVTNVPCLITMLRVGSQFIVDATQEEEVCSKSKFVLGVCADGSIMLSKMLGSGSLHPESITDVLETGRDMGIRLNTQLMEKLKLEDTLPSKEKSFLA